jgi:hypothetical protein
MADKRSNDEVLDEAVLRLRAHDLGDLASTLFDRFESKLRRGRSEREEKKLLAWAYVAAADLAKARGHLEGTSHNKSLFARIGKKVGLSISSVIRAYTEVNSRPEAKAVRAKLVSKP